MLEWRRLHEALRTRGRYYIGSVEESEDKNATMAMDVPAEEDHEQELWDDIDGQELDPETVKKARALEMEWYMKMNVYEKRPLEECFEKTKRPHIKVKWVDQNQGVRYNVNVRSRLVAKQIKTGKEEGLFAETPPLEALRTPLSATVAGNKLKAPMFNDISREYMHARTASDVYVGLCEEDKTEPGDEHRCGKFVKSMYGTRAAAHNWKAEVTRTMTDLGFKQGKASPCVFWHRQRDIKAPVDGYYFVSSGERAESEWLCKVVNKKFETKMIMVGEDDDMAQEARVKNRIVGWHGIPCEADSRNAEIIIRYTGAENLKTISTPATKETEETEEEKRQDLNGRKLSGKLGSKTDDDDRNDALSVDEVTRCRRIAARANFLAQDSMDIAYGTKEATRRMTAPTTDDCNKLVRLGRYLARYPRDVKWYKYQNASEEVVACTDSDWAGCTRTRRSTFSGCMQRGQHMLKFWSKTQAVVALSSAEAGLGAAVKASHQEVLGKMSLEGRR